MQPGIAASKLLQRKWEKDVWESHRRRLSNVKAQIKTNNLVMHKLSASKHGKKQLLRDLALQHIQKENDLLVKRIVNVRPGVQTRPAESPAELERNDPHAYGPNGQHSLNARVRRQELLHIMRENKRLVQRIENRKPILDREEWRRHAENHDAQVSRLAGGTVQLPPIRRHLLPPPPSPHQSQQQSPGAGLANRPSTSPDLGRPHPTQSSTTALVTADHPPARNGRTTSLATGSKDVPRLKGTSGSSHRGSSAPSSRSDVTSGAHPEMKVVGGKMCIYDNPSYIFPSKPDFKANVTIWEHLVTRTYHLVATTTVAKSDPQKHKQSSGAKTQSATITIESSVLQSVLPQELQQLGLYHIQHRAILGRLLASCLDIQDDTVVFMKPTGITPESIGLELNSTLALQLKGRNIPRLKAYKLCNPVAVVWLRDSRTNEFVKVGHSEIARNTHDPEFEPIVLDLAAAGWKCSGEGLVADASSVSSSSSAGEAKHEEHKNALVESKGSHLESGTTSAPAESQEPQTSKSGSIAPVVKICIYDATNPRKITNSDLVCTARMNLALLFRARDESIRHSASQVALHNAYSMVTASGTPKLEFGHQGGRDGQPSDVHIPHYPLNLPLYNLEGGHALGGVHANAKSSLVVAVAQLPANSRASQQQAQSQQVQQTKQQLQQQQERVSPSKQLQYHPQNPQNATQQGPASESDAAEESANKGDKASDSEATAETVAVATTASPVELQSPQAPQDQGSASFQNSHTNSAFVTSADHIGSEDGEALNASSAVSN